VRQKLQADLFKIKADKTTHGGSLALGKRKAKRPFIPKRPVHLVMRSSKARGEWSFLRSSNSKKIHAIIQRQGKKHHVKIYEYVNVGNHLHMKVRGYSREKFQAFLISVTALIARAITGAKKGHGKGKFWDALAFTRILKTSFEEKHLAKYFRANELEARFGKEIREIFLGRKSLTPV
jgi:hypothetical protein